MKSSRTPIIGQSPAIRTLRQLISAVAASNSTALVTGESGTGKELVAQALHQQSPRADGPFVPINCGAIPRELIESELFGHRKGAFTGASVDRLGRFELAHGGTLFLDEIGDLPMDMQVRLLRVLQERCILPVGASREVPIDVRVVAATHRNLEDEVRAGRFREDLYYRLNVLPLQTTPLRERSEDIAELLNFYADRHAQPGQRPVRLSPGMLALLCSYHWPGNVRELSNLMDRFSTLFAGQTLQVHSVPSCMLPSGLATLQADVLRLQDAGAEVPLSALLDAVHEPPVASAGVAVIAPSKAASALAKPAPSDSSTAAAVSETAGFFGTADAMAHLLAPMDDAPAIDLARFVPPPVEAVNDELSQINDVEQAILLAQGIQTLPPEGISLKQHLIDIERSLIEQALARTQGNVSKTARLLQLQRTTLIEKINKYDLRANAA